MNTYGTREMEIYQKERINAFLKIEWVIGNRMMEQSYAEPDERKAHILKQAAHEHLGNVNGTLNTVLTLGYATHYVDGIPQVC